ncbi:uncharacterized protein EHS24_002495 [Apiotrichum porosum]|uniref:Uncharacterized protein n=1 Tax=Apiotrichum porosum TaxID=105984 RepID=A0A427XGL4_9TREE|nr:uncharacterized protein EHS24_002495 [Apiotrichum porosum]RSH78040.1 hypothetical protein EHS24_002495 [Apiotrichum porosum]
MANHDNSNIDWPPLNKTSAGGGPVASHPSVVAGARPSYRDVLIGNTVIAGPDEVHHGHTTTTTTTTTAGEAVDDAMDVDEPTPWTTMSPEELNAAVVRDRICLRLRDQYIRLAHFNARMKKRGVPMCQAHTERLNNTRTWLHHRYTLLGNPALAARIEANYRQKIPGWAPYALENER